MGVPRIYTIMQIYETKAIFKIAPNAMGAIYTKKRVISLGFGWSQDGRKHVFDDAVAILLQLYLRIKMTSYPRKTGMMTKV